MAGAVGCGDASTSKVGRDGGTPSSDSGYSDGGQVADTSECDARANVTLSGLSACRVVVPGHFYIANLSVYTGPLGFMGDFVEPVPLHFVGKLNTHGGLKGKCAGLLRCDWKGTSEGVGAVLSELKSVDKLVASFGQIGGALEPQLEALRSLGKPFMEYNTGVSDHVGLVFGGAMSVATEPKIVSEAVYFAQPGKHLAIVHDFPSDSPGQGGFSSLASTRAKVPLFQALVDTGKTDYKKVTFFDLNSAKWSDVAASGADVVYWNVSSTALAGFEQMTLLGYHPAAIFHPLFWQQPVLEAAQTAPFLAALRDVDYGVGPSREDFVAGFMADFKRPPAAAEGVGYDSLCLLVASAELAKDPLDGDEVAKGLHAHFGPGGELAKDCMALVESARRGVQKLDCQPAGTLSAYGDDNEAAGMVSTVTKLDGRAWKPIGCYDSQPDLAPACP